MQEHKQTPEEATQILNYAASQARLTRAEHIQVQGAIQTIKEALAKLVDD